MRVTVDREYNVGYIYLVPIQKGEAVEQVVLRDKNLVLDFNKRGQLLGIEFLDSFRMPPFAKGKRVSTKLIATSNKRKSAKIQKEQP